ncbi:hypothetical protein OJ996_08995 [Luteolibacter sp. GHJ8]|uniref:DNA 5'-3' helicase n=1 Tax=Luteolibacter rhizosphaerae TaxID=2989719 RepID=A0ABT3G2I5_9BACT|nr:DnaB-like helicase C-terminal domain-containing protein [Luteolibacter rhizosphaerae]MCW1913709.1 hypothetical protein [Luteolibacter rhizosphaerae]
MKSPVSEPPHSKLAEKAVLSLMMRDEETRRRALLEGIGEDHFYCLQSVYLAVTTLSRSGATIDAISLTEELRSSGDLEGVGGESAVVEMWEMNENPRGWKQWVRALANARIERIKEDGLRWAADAKTPEAALEALRTTQEEMRQALAGPNRSKTAQEVAILVDQELHRLYNAGAIPGIPTGMGDLDQLTGGMKYAQLWVIAAETSRGKSVLMYQLGCSAIANQKRVAIFSAEMTVEEVGIRLISHRGKIMMDHLSSPKSAGKGHMNRMQTQLKLLAEEPFSLDDTPRMSLSYLYAECQRLAEIHGGLDLVIVDYLQILDVEVKRTENRQDAVSKLSSGLKQLAKLLRCPVVTGSQLNDNGQLRESRAIGQDADVLLAIGADGIRIQKNRNGKRDETLHYRLVGEIQTFAPFDPKERTAEQEAADEAAEREKAKKRSSGRDRQHRN